MSRNILRYPRGYFKYDLTAGIVVFLVAIPLCLGVALASGAPLFSGIISGFIGGIIVGILSDSCVSVSGPAAGMVAIVLAAITALNGFETFLLALFLAGILQILIGIFRAGFIADYIPSNVIQGLLCAIGILIIIKQVPFAFTYTAENAELLNALKTSSETFSFHPLEHLHQHINLGATLIALISLGLLIFFDKTKNLKLKKIPAPIIVVVLGVVLNELYIYLWPGMAQLRGELVNIPVNGSVFSFFNQFMHPNWQSWKNPDVYLYAFILAAVASLEALLNVEAIEKIDKVKRHTSRNRELLAQGIGNTLSGWLGGLPITSVIVRSSVNIQAHGKSKLSTIIHGVLILLAAIAIPHWMNLIPLASLAAILIYVGFKLTKPHIYRDMYAQGFPRFLPFIITLVAIIFSDLLTGILIGLFFSFFFILRDNSRMTIESINEKHPQGMVKRIILRQYMSFLTKAPLVAELNRIPPETHLIIDARYSKYIDDDILEVLQTFKNSQAPSKKIALNMLGFKNHYEILNQSDFLNVTTYDMQSLLQPVEVLEILKEGNKRFASDHRIHRSLLDDIKATSFMQHPIAIVLACIDSRVPVETIFDMGVGDVFVIRVAGNVVNKDIVASLEFACNIAGAKLVVVLGHTFCGAIKAACNMTATGHLGHLLDKIKRAIDAETSTKTDRTSENFQFMMNVTNINVNNSLNAIYQKSPTLRGLLDNRNIELMGAIYDVRTGEVIFQNDFYRHSAEVSVELNSSD